MKTKLLILLVLPLLFVGCDSLFDKGDVEKTYDGPAVVEFAPLLAEAKLSAGTQNIKVQLIGEQRGSDLSVSFSIGGDAVEGTHYTISSSPVTISANSSSADVVITLIDGSLAVDEEVELLLNLEGGDGVEAAENLKTSTVYIIGD